MKRNVIKTIITALGVVTCSLCLVATPVNTISTQAASTETTVQPRAAILEWVYRITDGKVYKRLVNCTTKQWVGDWIYVGEA